MNLTDLHEVLDERSATYDVEARSHLTLTGVHRRLAIRRRRRIAATAAAVVVVLAAGAGTLAVNRPARRLPTPAASLPAPMVGGFPEYAAGARVIAAASAPVSAAGLTFTPTTTDLVFFEKCTPNRAAPKLDTKGRPVAGPMHYLALNGHRMFGGTGCGGSHAANLTDPADGLVVGRPNTLTVTFAGTPEPGFAVAVGEKIPVDQYVFPSRPPTLEPLVVDDLDFDDPDAGERTSALLRADPAEPNRPAWATVTWGKGMHLLARAQTPGRVTVTIGEVTLAQGEWWDYQQGMVDGGREDAWTGGPLPAPGARVTITVTPERMTGDWAVALLEGS